MEFKDIEITEKYLDNPNNLEEVQNETLKQIEEIYRGCMNEMNSKNIKKCYQKLSKSFRYVPDLYIIPNGRVVIYINAFNYRDKRLYYGGVVTECTSDYIKLFNYDTRKTFLIKRKNVYFFVKLSKDEMFRMLLLKNI